MDGVSGDDVLAALLDITPEGRVVEPARPRRRRAAPAARLAGRPQRCSRCCGSRPGRPGSVPGCCCPPGLAGAASTGCRCWNGCTTRTWCSRTAGCARRTRRSTPPSPGERSWAFADLSLADVKRVEGVRAGLTVNDVVMALCAGALRRWLQVHDALPDEPLVAAVPVSVRSGGPGGPTGNQLSVMFAGVPTNLGAARASGSPRSAPRCRSPRPSTRRIPPTMLGELTGFALPMVAEPGLAAVRALAAAWSGPTRSTCSSPTCRGRGSRSTTRARCCSPTTRPRRSSTARA